MASITTEEDYEGELLRNFLEAALREVGLNYKVWVDRESKKICVQGKEPLNQGLLIRATLMTKHLGLSICLDPEKIEWGHADDSMGY